MMKEYKLTAPGIDFLLDFFEESSMEPVMPSKELGDAMDQLFDALRELAPSGKNSEEKSIWIKVPRGTIENYASYDDMVKWGEVETRGEYEARWKQDYPDPVSWYELVIREAFQRDGRPWFRGVWLDGKAVVNPWVRHKESGAEEAAIVLCTLLTMAAKEAMEKVRKGTYNKEVSAFLPDHFHAEVMKEPADEEKPVWTGGTKIQNLRSRGKYAFRHEMLARSANYNILCRWLTERIRVKNDQYAL